MVPPIRIQVVSDLPIRKDAEYVLYWVTASRRLQWNFALDRALELADELGKPLLVFEALRLGYRWASDRFHRFILEGMRDNHTYAEQHGINYFPFVETERDSGKGLLETLAKNAAAVVTDDFPCFFLPRMIAAAAKQMPVRFEKVDSNGLLPMSAAEQTYPSAYAFRRFLQKTLPEHLKHFPHADPWQGRTQKSVIIPPKIVKQWPIANAAALKAGPEFLAKLPIDHAVKVVSTKGGSTAAHQALHEFLENRIHRYAEDRNQPEEQVTSQLSPYLHFGYISVHQVFAELIQDEEWSPHDIAKKVSGSREGWWNMSPTSESFLDEIITWRELGYNFCHFRDDYDKYESLPDWAQETLAEHAKDKRAHLYTPQELEEAQTHDDLWNAAQMELVKEGRIHNYLRMLWGKKILQWSPSPRAALDVMIELNNKYALDGRNPNSYSGIFWILGRYDRPWGPERPIFGKIRYMTSENTARKVKVKGYIARHTP